MHNDAFPERFASEPLFLNLATESQGYIVTGRIPCWLWPFDPFFTWDLVATSCLRSGSPLPKMDQARSSRASLVVFAQGAHRVELGDIALRPFPALQSSKRPWCSINGLMVIGSFRLRSRPGLELYSPTTPRRVLERTSSRYLSPLATLLRNEFPLLSREASNQGGDWCRTSRHNLEEAARSFFRS